MYMYMYNVYLYVLMLNTNDTDKYQLRLELFCGARNELNIVHLKFHLKSVNITYKIKCHCRC